MRRLAFVAPVLLALFAVVSPTAAQTVVGRVTEEGTLRPLEGVFVVLQTEDGVRRQGVLTGMDGTFFLRGAPGRFRVLAELIGHSTARTEPFTLEAGATVRRELAVPIEAVTLEGIEVETGARCRRRPSDGGAMARLWDEARKALEVTRWGEQERVFRFRAVEFDRVVDARTGEISELVERPRAGVSSSSMYRSIPADSLAHGGYVRQADDGSVDYYAPDAEVLLSDSFLDTHCFTIRAPPARERELIGLGFEPLPGRTVAEVEGVLWLERGSAELRRLDFTYRGLPFGHGDWAQAGGRVDFTRLPAGVWIVERWVIRMPLRFKEVGGYGTSAQDVQLVVLKEHGAQVRTVTTAAGQALWPITPEL